MCNIKLGEFFCVGNIYFDVINVIEIFCCSFVVDERKLEWKGGFVICLYCIKCFVIIECI